MPDDLDDRIRAAIRSEADSSPLTLTEAMVTERLPTSSLRRPAAIAAVVALIAVVSLVALGPLRVGTVNQPTASPNTDGVGCPVSMRGAMEPEFLASLDDDVVVAAGLVQRYVDSPDVVARGYDLAIQTRIRGDVPQIAFMTVDAPIDNLDPGDRVLIVGRQLTPRERLNPADCVPLQRIGHVELPAGTFVADRPLGHTCVAITVAQAGDSNLNARWWDVGASADCSTATSSIVNTSARLVDEQTIEIKIPLMSGDERPIHFDIVGLTPQELTALGDDGSETREIRFLVGEREPVSDPASAPNPGSSCDELGWPDTAVSCEEARDSVSLGMTSVSRTRIWLTTLAAVDAEFGPGQQVADHPTDPMTPVWLFIYDGDWPGILHSDEGGEIVTSEPDSRVLHVADATNSATRGGAFIYLYGWSELGSPDLPTVMPESPGYTLDCGPMSVPDCEEHAEDIVSVVRDANPDRSVVAVAILNEQGHADVTLDDGTEIGWGERLD